MPVVGRHLVGLDELERLRGADGNDAPPGAGLRAVAPNTEL